MRSKGRKIVGAHRLVKLTRQVELRRGAHLGEYTTHGIMCSATLGGDYKADWARGREGIETKILEGANCE